MNSFYFMLQKIRERPGVFLGRKSLEALIHFLNGYAIGGETFGQPEFGGYFQYFGKHIDFEVPFMPSGNYVVPGFNEFVHTYFNCEMTTQGGTWLIVENINSDEEAFDKFFELLDEFMGQ